MDVVTVVEVKLLRAAQWEGFEAELYKLIEDTKMSKATLIHLTGYPDEWTPMLKTIPHPVVLSQVENVNHCIIGWNPPLMLSFAEHMFDTYQRLEPKYTIH